MTEHPIHEADDARRRAEIARLLLDRSGLPYKANGLTMEFREGNRPPCDFYPTTGRWRVHRGRRFKYYRGGPVAFINWYTRQQESTKHEDRAADHRGLERPDRTD